MIVGINGKIRSGKDTIAKIWQLLASTNLTVEQIEEDLTQCSVRNTITRENWEIRRFADKLKETIAFWLGVPRSLLESEDFKNSLLPEEWQVYEIYPLREGAPASELVFLTEEEAAAYCVRGSYTMARFKKSERTVRWLLQHVGTKLFRNQIHPNVHIAALFNGYHETRNWLIPDMRFPNELTAVEVRNGITLRVIRPFQLRFPEYANLTSSTTTLYEIPPQLAVVNPELYKALTNESETALDKHPVHYTLTNSYISYKPLIEEIKILIEIEKKIITVSTN